MVKKVLDFYLQYKYNMCIEDEETNGRPIL